ncbi:MAG: fatty acid desaturase family protein [Ignavibacteriales bacterium]|nr:fatty acid desaturase family protein [Ignavibacteriales bacterium]
MQQATQTKDRESESQIYYCDGSDNLSTVTRKSISREQWASLRLLQSLDTRYNWKTLFFVGIWIAAGWIALSVEYVPAQIPSIILMSFSLNGLAIMMHESCHSLLSKDLFVNRWLGFLCGIPGLVAVSAYRSVHIAHHAHTKTEDDPDNVEGASAKGLPLVFVYYAVLLMGIYFYIPTVAIVGYQKGKARVRKEILQEYAFLIAFIVLLFLVVPLQELVTVWILPLLVAAQLSNVRGLAEHGLTTGGNDFTASRTVVSNAFVSFFMCNLNYHLEHHLFPGIPWYNLRKVHRLLEAKYAKAGSSVYSSYTDFLVDFFKVTCGRTIVPNVRLIPAHIREEICL